jgi:hypothetical protein
MRLEVGTTSGAWIGVRTGSTPAENLGVGWEETMAPLSLVPAARMPPAGPLGLGGGVWSEQWGATFSVAVMSATGRFSATRIGSQYLVADSTYIADTSTTASTGTALLARVSAQRTISRLTLQVTGGFLSTPTVRPIGFASTSAAFRLVPQLSLIATAGTRGSAMTSFGDPFQARPYVSGGLSLSVLAPAPSRGGANDHAHSVRASLTRRPDGDYVLVIRAPGAHRVRVRADFTDWVATDCNAERGGRWTIPSPIAPGVHRLTIRIDDGAWKVPADLPAAASEYGDTVGVIMTPSAE